MHTVKDTAKWPGPSMKRNRRRRSRRRREKETSSVMCTESPEDLRSTVAVPRVTDNLLRETSTCSSIFSPSNEHDALPIRSQGIVPTTQSKDAVLWTHPKGVAPPVSPKDMTPPVQSNDISSCSEVETLLGNTQPRKKARKRRRITSKLSLSQSSIRHQKQSTHASDDVQFLKEVAHNPVSTSTTCSGNSNQTSQDVTDSIDPSRYVARQDISFGSKSLLASSIVTDADQPAKSLRQSVHILSHRQAQTSPCANRKTAESIARTATSLTRQHTDNEENSYQKTAFSYQSPYSPVVPVSQSHRKHHSHTKPQMSCIKRQDDLSLTSTSEDSDMSVYYEACSRLSILEESRPGPSHIQKNPECPTGQAVHPIRQKGDADTSSSSLSLKESDYTSHSFSSSGSNTFVSESVLNKTVLINKQQASTTHTRATHEAPWGKDCLTNQRQIKRHLIQPSSHPEKWQASSQPRTSQGKPTTIARSHERIKRLKSLDMGPPIWDTKKPQQKKVEVSSSTSECVSEEELSRQHLLEAKKAGVKADSRLSSSTVSSSSCDSSSDSSVLLTQAGKRCIQTVGEVFKHYFGGTVENNLTLLQKNSFNLLQCLLELQKASSSQPHSSPTHQPREDSL